MEYDAGRIEFYANPTHSYCSFFTLKENFENMLTILTDMLMKPVFNEDKLSVEISTMKDNIKRRNDSPMNVAFVNFAKKLRRGHPSGWFPTLGSVDKITREDVIEFHKKYYHPNTMILAFAGDFNSDSLFNKLNIAFKEWAKEELKLPEIPDLEERQERKIYYVEKDVAQSTIIMGHLSIYRKDPDLYSLQIGNYILGGGPTSWLNGKVREEEGLAYVVGSGLSPGYFYKGEFNIFCQTEAKSTVKAIELILNEVNKIGEIGPDSAEFTDAKESIKNQFVFTFESSLQIVANAASLEFFNMPKDYYDKYVDNISRVNKKGVVDAFQRKIFPDKMEILVVGKAEDFDRPLNELGTVEEIKLEE